MPLTVEESSGTSQAMPAADAMYGNVQPDSDLEAASIASGIGPAHLDSLYDEDSPIRDRHKHS